LLDRKQFWLMALILKNPRLFRAGSCQKPPIKQWIEVQNLNATFQYYYENCRRKQVGGLPDEPPEATREEIEQWPQGHHCRWVREVRSGQGELSFDKETPVSVEDTGG